MKVLSLLLVLVSSSSVFASLNDFECRFRGENGEQVLVEVERSYSPGMKRINVSVVNNGVTETYDYFTTARMSQMNRIEYFGGGLNLKIDLWPDTRPRYGRNYRSEFNSYDVNNGRYFYNIYCQFLGFNQY